MKGPMGEWEAGMDGTMPGKLPLLLEALCSWAFPLDVPCLFTEGPDPSALGGHLCPVGQSRRGECLAKPCE